MTEVLLDTGPLVAYLDASERAHEWVVGQWRRMLPPLIICEPVFTETVFLLRERRLSLEPLWELIRRGILSFDFELNREFETVAMLMNRYGNLPMDLADACLVRMAETRRDACVFTLDSDFKIYRQHGRQVIPLIFPD
jgi:predicted nucleic acid-binding protein